MKSSHSLFQNQVKYNKNFKLILLLHSTIQCYNIYFAFISSVFTLHYSPCCVQVLRIWDDDLLIPGSSLGSVSQSHSQSGVVRNSSTGSMLWCLDSNASKTPTSSNVTTTLSVEEGILGPRPVKRSRSNTKRVYSNKLDSNDVSTLVLVETPYNKTERPTGMLSRSCQMSGKTFTWTTAFDEKEDSVVWVVEYLCILKMSKIVLCSEYWRVPV